MKFKSTSGILAGVVLATTITTTSASECTINALQNTCNGNSLITSNGLLLKTSKKIETKTIFDLIKNNSLTIGETLEVADGLFTLTKLEGGNTSISVSSKESSSTSIIETASDDPDVAKLLNASIPFNDVKINAELALAIGRSTNKKIALILATINSLYDIEIGRIAEPEGLLYHLTTVLSENLGDDPIEIIKALSNNINGNLIANFGFDKIDTRADAEAYIKKLYLNILGRDMDLELLNGILTDGQNADAQIAFWADQVVNLNGDIVKDGAGNVVASILDAVINKIPDHPASKLFATTNDAITKVTMLQAQWQKESGERALGLLDPNAEHSAKQEQILKTAKELYTSIKNTVQERHGEITPDIDLLDTKLQSTIEIVGDIVTEGEAVDISKIVDDLTSNLTENPHTNIAEDTIKIVTPIIDKVTPDNATNIINNILAGIRK